MKTITTTDALRSARVWDSGPQPGRDVDTVTDIDGDAWERWMSDDDRYPDVWSPDGDPEFVIGWDELVKELGPLRDATDEPIEMAS